MDIGSVFISFFIIGSLLARHTTFETIFPYWILKIVIKHSIPVIKFNQSYLWRRQYALSWMLFKIVYVEGFKNFCYNEIGYLNRKLAYLYNLSGQNDRFRFLKSNINYKIQYYWGHWWFFIYIKLELTSKKLLWRMSWHIHRW